jgi:hypothetical protein
MPRMLLRIQITIVAVLGLLPAAVVTANPPDPSTSYYVPEAGPVGGSAIGGLTALQFFHACPNNHGGTSLPNNARIKVILLDSSGLPATTTGMTKDMIYLLFNGGTPAQGFTGSGADSIIANSMYNPTAPQRCPNVRRLEADAAPVGNVAYLTFAGANPANPGVTQRDPCRKWGHYDSVIPVLLNGVPLSGHLSEADATPYVLRIKNFDISGGLAAAPLNSGERVNLIDYNVFISAYVGNPSGGAFWYDFNSNGVIDLPDFNMFLWHYPHTCGIPNADAGACP